MSEYTDVIRCNMCLGGTKKVKSLGMSSVAGSGARGVIYPLDLIECGSCGHHQLAFPVPSEVIYKHYPFRTPEGARARLAKYAEDLRKQFSGKVLEIGCNNGLFLEELNRVGFEAYGVDPVSENGLPKWFGSKAASRIEYSFGKFNLVVANDTFDHVDDIRNTLRGVDLLLAGDGVLVFEVPLCDSIEKAAAIACHERRNYFSPKTWPRMLKKFGMEAFKTEKNDACFRMYVRRSGAEFFKVA
ncbi:MAG TPA: methyltransferase domain-containing protein, partial [Terriglobales bacterium]